LQTILNRAGDCDDFKSTLLPLEIASETSLLTVWTEKYLNNAKWMMTLLVRTVGEVLKPDSESDCQ
jgi:hypothetical protein